ncbi:MAG: hypothetical protein Kow0079_01920 [Vicingaceae bacterium]
MKKSVVILILGLITISGYSQKNKKTNTTKTTYDASIFNGFRFRSIGPAFTSGRIADIAVNPNNFSEYYLAAASGGVWKTTNSGNTFSPIFDGYGSYSIGCVTIDPNNTNIVWVGTGENNNQRSVGYGDGVYKSEDGGASFKNMGLKNSEHISKIIVHPNNSNIVYVAAYGPLWSDGGDRGIYKTEDGGKTWTQVLKVSDKTGFCDLIMDPSNPNTLYAAAHQRRRHVFTYVGGGPESGIYKTVDGGKTWEKANNGLPTVDIGRIGLAISPANPDYIYAIVEASDEKGGFFRSTNKAVSWEKRSSYATSGNYYQEIICDPKDKDKVFVMDTWLHHTEDGGKTVIATGEKSKHVDNHCIWIDPNNTNHWLVGCDGGLYETWDHAENWQFKTNLPITQFYKVALDNDYPFYNVFGGTQDNSSQGGPSRTINNAGILNSDWYITNGGDGFESQADPKDPNIVYAQAQYGWLVRYDKSSGQKIPIQPIPAKGEKPYRWNWDAPLLISPHNHTTLYFAANKLFKSTDRGDTWKAISGDLSRQLDRNKMKVMGQVWSMDAVMKNKSTTIYGNIVALDESPVKKGLIYVGTDDGLIQVTENDGEKWTKYEVFPGVPELTYVNMLLASQHNENVVYAVFNNHKRGDFKPYILKSNDKGKTWTSIVGNLPVKGSVYSIAEDHVNPDLLFAGTEFGLYFTLDGGKEWYPLKNGLPTIAIRDIAIQKRENDLVLASFGRGFYILDDYSPLRAIIPDLKKKKAFMFDIKKSLLYVESNPLGYRGKSAQGESLYTGENPPVGAVFTFYYNDSLKTTKQKRKEVEKKSTDDFYPSIEQIRKEQREEEPYLLFIIKNDKGEVIKKIKQSPSKGITRVVWNFRYSTTTPIKLKEIEPGRYSMADDGYLAIPGRYTVEVVLNNNGEISQLTSPKEFEVEWLNNHVLEAKDKNALLAFQSKVSELRRSVRGALSLSNETENKLKYFKTAIDKYPTVPLTLSKEIINLQNELKDVNISLAGDYEISKYEFETYPSILDRIETIVYGIWNATSAPTNTFKESYQTAQEEYQTAINQLQSIVKKVEDIQKQLDALKVPYTPGRSYDWKEE